MSEEQNQEVQENASPETGSEVKEKKSLLEQSIEAAENLKEQNRIMTENIDRMEKLKAEDMLGGTTPAGQAPPEKKKKMTPEEYTRYVEKHGKAPDEQ